MSKELPLAPTARIESIDVIRGWALLGILVINIWTFGHVFDYSFDPSLHAIYEGADIFAFFTSWIGFEGSQRALFSMLFGASVVLLTSRLESGDRLKQARYIYYRRTLILMAFGLIDIVVFLWYGDVLYLYGLIGLLLYFVRNLSPKKLIALSSVVLGGLILFFRSDIDGFKFFRTP